MSNVSGGARRTAAETAPLTGRGRGAVLGLLAVVVLAAPVLVLSAFVLRTVSSDVAERSASQRLQTVDLAARLVDDRLTTAGAELVSLAGRRSLRDALRSRDAAGTAVHLHDLKASSDGYTTAVALDSRGISLVGDPNDPAVVGRDLSARDYFVGGMAAPSPFTSEAFAAAGGPVPVAVAVSLGVRDERGVLGLNEGRTRPLGAADHLTKPIETARLRRGLDLVADGQRGRV